MTYIKKITTKKGDLWLVKNKTNVHVRTNKKEKIYSFETKEEQTNFFDSFSKTRAIAIQSYPNFFEI